MWLPGIPSAAAQKTPPGSFLKYRASGVSELVAQASRDKAVRARYARHFCLSPDKVPAFLAKLRLVALTQPTKVRAYYVGPGGRVHAKTKLLPRGAKVFVSAQGRPLISWACGNPLRAETPTAPRKKQGATGTTAPDTHSVMAGPPKGDTPVDTNVLAQPPETVGQPPIESAPVESVLSAPAESLVLAEAPTVAMPGAFAAAAPPVGTAFNAMPAIGGLAGLIGGLAAFEVDRSNSSSQPEPQIPVVPVPEPTAMAALAIMSSGLILVRGFRKR